MVLLMMGVLFCCGAGFFIRRRMYPSPLRDEPAFNVSFTRHPVTTPGTTACLTCVPYPPAVTDSSGVQQTPTLWAEATLLRRPGSK
uniref:WW domain binding protein VOPP1 n=1 Tax=Stegastes partitus TaxID=144197 RepID=A0A3B5AW29_9TELE